MFSAPPTPTVTPLGEAVASPPSRTVAVSDGATVPTVTAWLSSEIGSLVPAVPVMLRLVVPNSVAPPVSDVASSRTLTIRKLRPNSPGGSNGIAFQTSVLAALRRP